MSESIITLKTVKNIIERRKREIHKGDCGRILIGAGSAGMAGAAVLAARGALRSGAGLVQLSIPEELFPIVQTGVVEATCLAADLSKINLSRYDAAAMGPGLGVGKESIRRLDEFLELFDGTLVIDADGLNIVASQGWQGRLRDRKGATIITPHMGEAARLLGAGSGSFGGFAELTDFAGTMSRMDIAGALAEKTGAITVLKGSGSLVAAAGKETYINTTGNPGMATAGSGDVLTGIITSLCGQKTLSGEARDPFAATLAAVYIHGLAGDLGAAEKGEYGLTAGDIAEYTAYAIKKIEEES